jgi:hypothetical protein
MSAATSFARPKPLHRSPTDQSLAYIAQLAAIHGRHGLWQCSTLLRPYRLSRDTLTRISCLCLPKPSSGRQLEVEFVRPLPHTTPLVLTHVCKVWREIAITIPALWASTYRIRCPSLWHPIHSSLLISGFGGRATHHYPSASLLVNIRMMQSSARIILLLCPTVAPYTLAH